MRTTMASNLLNGGQVIVDYLVQEEVPYAFGLCGHGNIGFIDALHERAEDIKTISVHHETVAGFMADVFYRVCGKPTATFTSCGPGSANLPICLANSFLDSVPFLAVTGNVPTGQFNRGAFQELYRHYQADFPSTVRAYCKRVFQPTRGDMVPLAIRQAWKTMVTGRPGPVVLDVPFDVFKEAAAEETPKPEDWNGNISCRCGAEPEGVKQAVDMLLAAERPVILVGQGVRYDGRTSSSWLPGFSFTIPPTKLIHVDIDPDEIARNYPVALGLMADVRTFLRQVLGELDIRSAQAPTSREAWLSDIQRWRKEWEEWTAPGYRADTTPIHPQRAAHEIAKVLPDDAIVVSDVGVHHNWLLQFYRPKNAHSLIGSMGFGAMGFGVAGGVWGAGAPPPGPLGSVCGDGAFLMHASVMATAVEYKIPAIWVVWNNYAYASIRGLQRGYLQGRELVTDFKEPDTNNPYNPDFAAMARSAGVNGVRVETAKDLGEALEAAVKTHAPCVIDANIQGESNPGGAGVWELPGLGHLEPAIGQRTIIEG